MARVQFRDGARELPEHLAELMAAIDTYKLTYDDAVAEANRKLMSDHLDKTLRKVVSQHFDDWKRT